MDIVGLIPKVKGNANYGIVVIDYFTKWIEVEPLLRITKANTSKCLSKNIICHFGIPHSPV